MRLIPDIDPDFAGGYAGAAWSYALPVLFHNTQAPDESLAQAVKLAEQAIAVDPGFGAGHAVLGFAQTLSGDKLKGLENADLSVAVQPGDAFVQFLKAFTLIIAGVPEEAFAALDEAMRLNPLEKRAPYLNVYGIGRFANHEYQTSLDMFARNQARKGPNGPHMEIFRAAAHAQLGEDEEASAIIRDLSLTFPDYPYTAWLESWLGQGQHLTSTLEKLAKNGLGRSREPLPE